MEPEPGVCGPRVRHDVCVRAHDGPLGGADGADGLLYGRDEATRHWGRGTYLLVARLTAAVTQLPAYNLGLSR